MFSTSSPLSQSTYRSNMGLDHLNQRSGFEVKGLLVLLICGFYAMLVFLTAALIRWAWSLVPSPVSYLKWSLSIGDTDKTKTKKASKVDPQTPRKGVNHG